MESYTYYFPRIIRYNMTSIEFLQRFHTYILENCIKEVLLNFENTVRFETNLLSFFSYILEKLNKLGIKVMLKLKRESHTIPYDKIIGMIFKTYSAYNQCSLKCRKINDSNSRQIEDLLIKHLKGLNIKGYKWIKIILSELIANIKMHTQLNEGTIAGYIDETEKMLMFSIVNYDITIKDNIQQKNGYIFDNDFDAIIWALKKTNTTRLGEEPGGLGLYLLRKYIAELAGDFSIISGKYYLEFNNKSYNEKDENKIEVERVSTLKNIFNGNMITIRIPFIIENTQMKIDDLTNQSIDLLNWGI
ncbi:hypothetical protein [Anaerosporobacter sp.]|uniref:hypothetical protein n=1 Tax=Anaerosporobacter sp. TaxID=1872529 RepID=UPI00286F6007|nr:hypothetical protein [Anaerosporobacter sp.]